MARALPALLFLIFFGCANPTRMTQPPHLDFGLNVEEPDLASNVEPDLSVPTDDLSMNAPPDQARPVDAAEDLQPASGCDDAGTSGHLFLAGVGASNTLVTSRFAEGGGWSVYQSANLPAVGEVTETLFAGRPLLAARQTDNVVSLTAADSCTQIFPSLASIGFGVTTALKPALLSGDLLFRGATGGDLNLYYMYRPSTVWLGPVKQNSMTTTMPFALVQFDGKLSVFYNDGGKLSEGEVKSQAGGGPSAQIGALTVAQPPVAVVDLSGKLHVVYVDTDTNLKWIWRVAGGAFSASHTLCEGQAGCLIDTNLPISMALDSSGNPVVAWSGINPHKVFMTRFLTTSAAPFFSTAATASGTCGTKDCETTLGPALATGIGSAQLELLFVSDLDGRARHARLLPVDMGSAWSEPASLAGTNLLNTPSVVASP